MVRGENSRTGMQGQIRAEYVYVLPTLLKPSNAVMVGVLMFSELSHVNFKDTAIAVSTFLIVVMMPLTFSITNGLAFGLISYLVVKLIKREYHDINIGIVFLTAISLIVFIVQ